MIDLSDIMKPVDIRINASDGGYVIVTCRESLYDESQTGAYAYASQGYDYRQILEAYYPGVDISRLEAK